MVHTHSNYITHFKHKSALSILQHTWARSFSRTTVWSLVFRSRFDSCIFTSSCCDCSSWSFNESTYIANLYKVKSSNWHKYTMYVKISNTFSLFKQNFQLIHLYWNLKSPVIDTNIICIWKYPKTFFTFQTNLNFNESW